MQKITKQMAIVAWQPGPNRLLQVPTEVRRRPRAGQGGHLEGTRERLHSLIMHSRQLGQLLPFMLSPSTLLRFSSAAGTKSQPTCLACHAGRAGAAEPGHADRARGAPPPQQSSGRSYGQQAVGKLLGAAPQGEAPGSGSGGAASGAASGTSSSEQQRQELTGMWEVLTLDESGRPLLER